jgi:hypothetical protein
MSLKTASGFIESYDPALARFVVRLDSGQAETCSSTAFVSDRPTRLPRIGERVEVVYSIYDRVLRIRSVGGERMSGSEQD